MEPADEPPVVISRRLTPRGELSLRRRGEHHEIISNGVFLMSTDGGVSERALVDEALALAEGASPVGARRLLLGGLGVGYSLARACAHPSLQSITVIEVEPTIVAWHRRHLASALGEPLGDPRVVLEIADLARWLRWETREPFDVICLDVDNGPDWTVTDANADLYGHAAVARWHGRLEPGGVLGVWSAHAAPAYRRRLEACFPDVREVRVPAPRGEDDHLYLARRAPSG
jgi:spermidine synthase